jgi:thymidylate synthase (FAD)
MLQDCPLRRICGKLGRMRETTPKVFLLARPMVDTEAMTEYLADVGGASWLERRASDDVPDAELLTEFAGRVCYRSWEPGLNPNITRIRTDRADYFENLLASGHGSVLEHANFTFVARNVSRVVTHEWVRHRAGAAYSQESLRYVRLTDLGFRVPPALEALRRPVLEIVERLEEFQRDAAQQLGLGEEGLPFHVKKEVTSALRRLAPIGLSTDIVATMNVRTLRHVITMRTDPAAEEEIRAVFDQIASICVAEAPALFQDFERDQDGFWAPRYRKV